MWLSPTSITALSSSCCVVVRKKLKYSSASLKIMLLSVSIPKRFLKKNISRIVLPTNDGNGLVLSSPAARAAQPPRAFLSVGP